MATTVVFPAAADVGGAGAAAGGDIVAHPHAINVIAEKTTPALTTRPRRLLEECLGKPIMLLPRSDSPPFWFA